MFVFGLAAFSEGVFQVRTGRRNGALVALMVLAVAAMIYLGYAITSTVVPEH